MKWSCRIITHIKFLVCSVVTEFWHLKIEAYQVTHLWVIRGWHPHLWSLIHLPTGSWVFSCSVIFHLRIIADQAGYCCMVKVSAINCAKSSWLFPKIFSEFVLTYFYTVTLTLGLDRPPPQELKSTETRGVKKIIGRVEPPNPLPPANRTLEGGESEEWEGSYAEGHCKGRVGKGEAVKVVEGKKGKIWIL